MKRVLLLLCLFVLGSFGTAQAQELMDYVSETRGDTLVIKHYTEMGNQPNSLIEAIRLDENPPAGRVYMLQAGSNDAPTLYPLIEQFTFPERPIQIVGEYVGQIVQGDDPDRRPPAITGWTTGENNDQAVNSNLLNAVSDLTYKNLALLPASDDGSEGWTFTEVTGEDVTVTLENVLGEHNNWTWIQSNNGVGTSLIIRDSYFLNATGVPTRRNGGVYDSENQPLDTIWVENTTHVQNAGMQYKFRNHPANKAVFNHNTFVNASGQIFLSFGYEKNFMVTNNLFVNSNVQAYWPGLDASEADQDNEPHGIINLDHFPEDADFGVEDAERMVLVDRNGVYWDEELDQIIATIEDRGWDGAICEGAGCVEDGEWMTQMITANEETQAIFDDDEQYPLITEGEWIMGGAPGFTRGPEDVDPDIMDAYITWNIETVSENNETLLQKLREADNAAEGAAILRFDWPVAVDLSYTNETYLTAGFDGYPLGDLNWYPEEKEQWDAEKETLYAWLEAALNEGTTPTGVEEVAGELPSSTLLKQNYPNPFNPTTTIQFELAAPADVQLTVYDVLGRRVATLVSERLTAGTYTVDWNALDEGGQRVSSGVYFYTLRTGDHAETKQMVLLK